MITEVLTATRERKSSYNCVTTLKDSNNKVIKIITGYNQPKNTKNATIVVRGKKYNLKFEL